MCLSIIGKKEYNIYVTHIILNYNKMIKTIMHCLSI